MSKKRGQPAVDGIVRSLTRRGQAIVDTHKGEVVVHGVVPGERVRVVIDGKLHGTAQGKVESIEAPSPMRVEPACPHVDVCGGCPWMHVTLSEQRRTKREMLANLLQREKLVLSSDIGWPDVGESLHYRTRARLHWDVGQRGRATLGFHGWRSNRVEDIRTCAVLAAGLNAALEDARTQLLPLISGSGELRVYQGRDAQPALALFTQDAQSAPFYAALERLVATGSVAGAALKVGASSPAIFGDAREYVPREGGPPLIGGLGGFSQANPVVNNALKDQAVMFADCAGSDVVELFAGFGNLTVPLAAHCSALTAVEADRDLTEACALNLAARGLAHAHVRCARAEDVAAAIKGDVLVLDPPREGAGEVARTVATGKFKRIVYVSCNPTTFARDAAALQRGRYVLERLVGFDMFPHTPHIETVALFSLR